MSASKHTFHTMSDDGSPTISTYDIEKQDQHVNEGTNAQALGDTAPATRAEVAKQETVENVVDVEKHGQAVAAPAAAKGPFALPPNHPMHPSQFSGDRFERAPVLCLIGAFFAIFCSFGWINCIGYFQEYYQENQLKGYSPSSISWIVSLETFFMFFGGAFVGLAYDRFGPRYLLMIGTFLHVFGLMMISLSTEYYQFILAQGICSPIGASMLFFATVTSTMTWFFKWRALAFGIVAAGSSLGGVILPIMVAQLIPQIGFAWTMRTCAFVILALLIISCVTITARLPPTKKPVRLSDFTDPLREIPFMLLTIGGFIAFFGIFIPIGYVVVAASSVGMSPRLQNYIVPCLNAASIFGRTIPGALADKIGRFNMFTIMSLLSIIFIFALWIPAQSNALIIVFACFFGFSSGAFVSLFPALIAEITPDLSKLGVRNGTSFAILSISALVGTPIAGQLLIADDSKFLGTQLFSGLTLVLGTMLVLACRYTKVGFTVYTKV